MEITPSNLSLFFSALETRFWTAYSMAPTWSARIATTYPVGTEQWVSGWIGMLDKLRMWKGPRVTRIPAPQTYLVSVDPFELTAGVDEFKLKDDQHGLYMPIAAQFGEQMAKWPDYQLRDLIMDIGEQGGAKQNGTDGLSHWNVAHPVDFYDSTKGTYCNDFDGGVSVNGVTVGGAFTTNGYNTLYSEFCSRKSESGEALGIMPDLTMVAPYLATPAKILLQSTFYAPPQMGPMGAGSGANAAFTGALDNPLRGTTDLLINPDFSDQPEEWYQLCTNRAIKPFSWLLREAPNFAARIQPTDPVVWDTHTYLWGTVARGAPAWALPWLSARSGPS